MSLNPLGAVRHAHQALAPDGVVLLVEPMAGERIEVNFNPLGRALSAASVLICTANSLADHGPAPGPDIATDAQLREVFQIWRLRRTRRATEPRSSPL